MKKIALFLAFALMSASAQADPVEDFYKGKQIRLLVGFASGGYDTYSRILASVMSKYIPGNPVIIVQNMPGGSSLNVANNLYSVAPKDGTVLGAVSKAMGTLPLLGGQGTDFKNGSDFNWIGSMNQEFSVLIAWADTGIKTLEDARNKELVIGANSPGANSMSLYPTIANKLLGTKLKMVYGYPGSNAMTLALERGEVSGRTWTWSTLKAERGNWLTEGKINVIMQWSMKRAPDLPNVPTIAEFAKSEADRQVFELIFGPQVMARPIVAPPGVPADRVKALRDAFNASMKDKDLLAEAEKRKIEISPATGQEVQDIVASSYKASPDVVKRANELVPLVN